MQQLCSEPGLWPESIEQLDAQELDVLIEHAADCSYHLSLLDEDEEKFLADLKQTSSLLSNGFDPQTSTGAKSLLACDIESELSEATAAIAIGGTGDPLYDSYRRWSDQCCPLEILQVRYGERILCAFDITHDGGSWRFAVNKGDGVLQFWTFCRRHNDRVRIAACDLPQCGSEQPEASTLLFTNGQSLSLQASRNERGDISVLVHCTAPRASDVRYAVYNFDSLVDGYSDLKVGREHCKSSEIVKDFAKFAELRFPIRDLEAAQLQDGLHREKCVDELMRVITEESFEEIEPLAPSCTTESEKLHGDQADESNQPQIVKQLKNWIRRQNSRHNQLYRFSRKVTTFTVQNYLNKNLPALENDDHDEPAECLGPFPSRDGERFPIDIDSLNFVLFSRESVCDLDVTKLVGRQDTSVMSEIYRIIGEYCAGLENESRWFVGTGIHGRGKFSKLPAYLPLPQDTATAAISPRVKTKVFPSCFYEGFSVVTSVTCFPPECERCNQISLQWIYAATGWDKINASYRSYALGSESQYSAELPTLPEKSSSRMLRFMSDLSCLTG